MKRFFLLALLLPALWSCKKGSDSALFRVHNGNNLGIDSRNTIVANDTFNALNFEYIYNGSGIGVGDFNNDGREDLFFGGNQVSSELYLNEGNNQFRKITAEAQVRTDRWVTGVTVIDVNRDGLLDIYLSVGGIIEGKQRENLLFINQGIQNGTPVFEEMAESYGLNDDSYSTMAAFFDYDKDGDPDMYLLNNWLEKFNRNNIRPVRVNGEAESTDKLYRNNGDDTFTDVSREAGILIEGYGLGVSVCDINNDSWPDVYVANDFLSSDIFWINQGDGTFRNRIGDFLKHQTHNAMGVDVADFNNDALADIVVVDMLPQGHVRQKLMTPGQNYDHFHMSLDRGYQPQYMRNTLQLNRGQIDDKVLFSEIAFQAGIAQTDWSWAPLFLDFNNDGWKDIFVANGYRKDVTNIDFVFFGLKNQSPFGTPKARKNITTREFEKLDDVKLPNHFFLNTGTLSFEDKTHEWEADVETFSNGAVYVDLDNDGDMDLVTNNIDQEVILYENLTISKKTSDANFIQLKCLDTASFNQKVFVYANGLKQFQELTPYRGFQSTVTSVVHFGIGSIQKVDSVIIEYPDGGRIRINDVASNSIVNFHKEMAGSAKTKPEPVNSALMFAQVDPIRYTHVQRIPSDIKETRTLLHDISRNGPCFASADVNGDNLDDIFIGGEPGVPATLYVQNQDGSFVSKPFTTDSTRNDGGAIFFDADNDGDQDLYLAIGSTPGVSELPSHKLYINDGHGDFRESAWIPKINTPSVSVAATDFDGDGDLDLFVAGRVMNARYPMPPRSYLLQNNGGVFTDVTESVNKELLSPGMITSAIWADVNNDGKKDLMMAGEWMPLRVFINDGDKLIEKSSAFGLDATCGWWTCLKEVDLNNDGFPEILAGNSGENSFFKPTPEHPVYITAKDFDNNESVDPIISYYNPVEADRFIVHNRLVLIDQIPAMKKRFETFTGYATTPFNKSFTPDELKDAFESGVQILSSVVLMNRNGKEFAIEKLPEIVQISSVNDFHAADMNDDGFTDVIAGGNNFAQETLFGRYDAGMGNILVNNKKGGLTPLNPISAKLVLDKHLTKITSLRTASGTLLVIVNHNGPMQFFRAVNTSMVNM